MHRKGHTGIVLLALAPVLSALLQANRPLIAVLCCGVLLTEPLPDYDLRTSLLAHRGISHSLLSAIVVGFLCALVGWLVGTYGTEPLAGWLGTTGWPNAERLALGTPLLTLIGFLVGSGGIVLHLLGDVITPMGVQPLRPFSDWTVSLSVVRASNRFANSGLFLLGLLAIGIVGYNLLPVSL